MILKAEMRSPQVEYTQSNRFKKPPAIDKYTVQRGGFNAIGRAPIRMSRRLREQKQLKEKGMAEMDDLSINSRA